MESVCSFGFCSCGHSAASSTSALARGEVSLADAVLAEVNLARSSPKKYAGLLREWRRHYEDRNVRLPGTDSRLVTSEGVAAVDEAIGFMAGQKPLPPLSPSAGLAKAARDLVRDEGELGTTGHTGIAKRRTTKAYRAAWHLVRKNW